MSKVREHYVNIQATVKKNKSLTGDEKILYSEIHSLVENSLKERGLNFCWASNEYLAESCGMSVRTVSRAVKRLKDLGFIDPKMDFHPETRKYSRQIYDTYKPEADTRPRPTDDQMNELLSRALAGEPGVVELAEQRFSLTPEQDEALQMVKRSPPHLLSVPPSF